MIDVYQKKGVSNPDGIPCKKCEDTATSMVTLTRHEPSGKNRHIKVYLCPIHTDLKAVM